MPSAAELTKLYQSFDGGMIPRIRAIRENNPLTKWYAQCVAKASQLVVSSTAPDFSWMDVGAGNGELALKALEKFPASNGVAVDFHDRPLNLAHSNIRWINTDINNPVLDKSNSFDLIFLITVLEHVMYPDLLVESLLLRLKPDGVLYITVPDFGSLASMLLRDKWPYFIPGEHLCIPSRKGIKKMLEKICQMRFGAGNFEIIVKATSIPYTIGYYWEFLGLGGLPNFISKKAISFPTGILEASVVIR